MPKRYGTSFYLMSCRSAKPPDFATGIFPLRLTSRNEQNRRAGTAGHPYLSFCRISFGFDARLPMCIILTQSCEDTAWRYPPIPSSWSHSRGSCRRVFIAGPAWKPFAISMRGRTS
jgi:hypothetical protein